MYTRIRGVSKPTLWKLYYRSNWDCICSLPHENRCVDCKCVLTRTRTSQAQRGWLVRKRWNRPGTSPKQYKIQYSSILLWNPFDNLNRFARTMNTRACIKRSIWTYTYKVDLSWWTIVRLLSKLYCDLHYLFRHKYRGFSLVENNFVFTHERKGRSCYLFTWSSFTDWVVFLPESLSSSIHDLLFHWLLRGTVPPEGLTFARQSSQAFHIGN